MKKLSQKYRITYNAPVTITFSAIALLALVLHYITGGGSTQSLFSVRRASSPLGSPLTWLRFFTHIFGHSDIQHYLSNILLILVLGPGLEDKLGKRKYIHAILLTALLSGLAEYVFFPGSMLLGASGVVFMMIVLASAGSVRRGELPLTLILVFCFYVGGEIIDGLFVSDQVSQLAHIIGGLCGAFTAIKKA